jgi:hypothetical protein
MFAITFIQQHQQEAYARSVGVAVSVEREQQHERYHRYQEES